MKVYNDAEMLLATQVAYLDIPPGMTVGEYVDAMQQISGSSSSVNARLEAQLENVSSFMEVAQKNGVTDWRSWKIVDNVDAASGMYACMIDTGCGDAILGFRGSESYDFVSRALDWGVADFMLLNSSLTIQQKDAEAFTRRMWELYGDKYGTFSFSGHSLGGNLAEHAAFTAPSGMLDRIDHAINFDGPGYSDEYLLTHAADILRAKDKVSHYQWSWVGALLTQPGGINGRVIQAHDDPTKEGIKSKLWRHDTRNVDLDGQYVQDLDPPSDNEFAERLGEFSRTMDYGCASILFYAIPIVGPLLGVADFVNRTVSFFGATFDAFERAVADLAAEWNKFAKALYQAFIAPKVSGDYSIQIWELDQAAGELLTVESRLARLSEEINEVRRSLPYLSLSGSYYKSKVWGIANGIGWDGDRIKRCAEAGRNIALLYKDRDLDVAGLYE